MSSSERISRTWCPVCENGTVGYCDERCESRNPNGQPGHFPGQIAVVMRNAPSVDDAQMEAGRVRTWRAFDNMQVA